MRTYFPHEDCVLSQMTEIRMQPSSMKVRPQHEAQSSPREPSPAAPPGHRPARPLTSRTHHKPQGPPLRAPFAPSRASARFGQPLRLRIRRAHRVRPRRSACPDSTGSLPSHSQESPSQQPRSLKNPRLSGGTSGRYWAASADSLRAYRRPSGQSLWNSWTPCPTCGVCVTTTLPQCPNGVRDH